MLKIQQYLSLRAEIWRTARIQAEPRKQSEVSNHRDSETATTKNRQNNQNRQTTLGSQP
jgi:hypothetical protein